MKVAVKDACVLIDLANAGLLDIWFQLGIETHTTDLVVRQVSDTKQSQAVAVFVAAGLLRVTSLDGDDMGRVLREFSHLNVGIEDKSVLYLATKLDAVLLTGDRRVRLEGMSKKLDVRGILWILDELVGKNLLTPRLAAAKLKLMLDDGAFLPDECDKRFKLWN